MIKKWLLPCNVKYFDIIKHFEANEVAYFKRNRYMTPGDIVYIYVSAPYSEILYKAEVLERGISAESIDDTNHVLNTAERTYVKVRLLKKFPHGCLPRKELFAHKLGQVVNQQRIRFELEDYIDAVELKIAQQDEGDN